MLFDNLLVIYCRIVTKAEIKQAVPVFWDNLPLDTSAKFCL